jgi:MinD superfamily P-loop ATPase
VIEEKELVKLFVKYSHHSMDPKVCKGCNQCHHFIVCPYDILAELSPDGESLVKEFEKQVGNKK